MLCIVQVYLLRCFVRIKLEIRKMEVVAVDLSRLVSLFGCYVVVCWLLNVFTLCDDFNVSEYY